MISAILRGEIAINDIKDVIFLLDKASDSVSLLELCIHYFL